MTNDNTVKLLQEKLLLSHWPKCNEISQQLFEINSEEAKSALIVGLKAKRHHIRTACIKTLVKFDDKDLVYFIEPLLNDSAYETRIEAKKAIFSLTGINLETSRGE